MVVDHLGPNPQGDQPGTRRQQEPPGPDGRAAAQQSQQQGGGQGEQQGKQTALRSQAVKAVQLQKYFLAICISSSEKIFFMAIAHFFCYLFYHIYYPFEKMIEKFSVFSILSIAFFSKMEYTIFNLFLKFLNS